MLLSYLTSRFNLVGLSLIAGWYLFRFVLFRLRADLLGERLARSDLLSETEWPMLGGIYVLVFELANN